MRRPDQAIAFLLVFVGWLASDAPRHESAGAAADRVSGFSRSEVAAVFPGAGADFTVSETTGTPPAAAVMRAGALLGYVFSTRAVAGSVGYSGKPIDIHVGLAVDGRITGARLVAHQEPILVIGIAHAALADYVAAFAGLDVRIGGALGKIGSRAPGAPDHVAGATVTSAVIRHGVLRSGRAVAASRGLLGPGAGAPRLDRTRFEPATWQSLVERGAVRHIEVTRGEAAGALGEAVEDPADALFVALFTALLTPPAIGQNLLGRRAYDRLVAELGPEDNAVLIAASGLYSFKGTEWRRSGGFERVRIAQKGALIGLRAAGHENLAAIAAAGAPELREIGVFRIPKETGFDPLAPWELELLVTRAAGTDALRTARFSLPYTLPEDLVVRAAGAPAAVSETPLWEQIWRARAPEIAILCLMLLGLLAILFFQDALTRRLALYRAVRLAFLTLTLVFLGLYAGAQLSVVNVATFANALVEEFRWELFLLDPLVFILWSFVALSLLFWGRGVFCGWLCPFGALQELANAGARRIGLRQIELPWALHERLWPIKYVAFLVILGVSLQSMIWAFRIAEVEPFKTAIALKFLREWPFVVYALALLGAGLFIERFFCRYLCPLGAALAIPARLKLFDWLKRRPQCGRECRICNTRCSVQAIHPLGEINPNECIYCLRCQANYFDAQTCPPLKRRAERRGRPAGAVTGGADAG